MNITEHEFKVMLKAMIDDVVIPCMEEYVDNKLYREVRQEVNRAMHEDLEATLKERFNRLVRKAIEERIHTVRVIVETNEGD